MQKTTVLILNKDFQRLYYRGRSAVDPALVTYALRNRTADQNRMGITVTKKIGTAVSRNRCKRIIRAAYRSLEATVPGGWDFIFVARGKTTSIKSTDLLPVMKKQIESLTAKDAPQPSASSRTKHKKKASANKKQMTQEKQE